MSASIGDVAKRAGVSVATVSRALRGLPNVAPSTRERVLEAADALAYVADPNATRLATGRTLTIGVAVVQIGQWFTQQVLSGVEAVLTSAGYDLLLLTVAGPDERKRFATGERLRGRVDGVIAVDVSLTESQQRRLAEATIPVVLLGVASAHLPSVCVDNVAVGRQATAHLIELGHRRIGLVGHFAEDPLDFPIPRARTRGHRDALRAAGIIPEPTLERPGNFSLGGGAEATAQLLDAPDRPSAIFALSDEMAIGALQSARARGLRIPEDLSVVGVDDHDMAEPLGLTTVAQSVAEQGEAAAELLLQRIDADPDPAHLTLPTRLVARASTGPAPAADLPSEVLAAERQATLPLT